MTQLSTIPAIKAIITSVASEQPDSDSVRELIAICRRIARTHLITKNKGRYSYGEMVGLSLDDLATDTIADLFQRNDQGVFVQIQSYFESINLDGSSEPMVFACLRRLICSKVNINLVALRGEHDPSFWKILRNCNLAIQTLRTFTMVERLGDTFIVPVGVDPLLHLPMLDQEEIEQLFTSTSSGNENIPLLLSRMSRHFQEQKTYSRMVRVLTVAAAIRAFYVRMNAVEIEEEDHGGKLEPADIVSIILNSSRIIRKKMGSLYVQRKGVDETEYALYFQAIEIFLKEKFVSNDGHKGSLFEYFQKIKPELSKEEYSGKHRAKLEYLLRLVEGRTVVQLRKQYN